MVTESSGFETTVFLHSLIAIKAEKKNYDYFAIMLSKEFLSAVGQIGESIVESPTS